MKVKSVIRYLTDKNYRWMVNDSHHFYDSMNDREYLEKKFRIKMGKELNLDSPETFNEKLQWLKLYDRKPIYTTMVDKYAVKPYVASIIGDEYIIPTLGVWDTVEDIDFDSLPDQFVLKCSHDSHGLVICKDKSQLNIQKTKQTLAKALRSNYYYHFREWPYKDVPPRIICEKYMEDSRTEELRDYKFFCFNSEVKLMFVASDRQKKEETKFDFFDPDYNHLPILNGHPNAASIPEKPVNFDLMKSLAAQLSKDIPLVRIDFYEVDGKCYFGEMTFFHWSGFQPFHPDEWDVKLGQMLDLPDK